MMLTLEAVIGGREQPFTVSTWFFLNKESEVKLLLLLDYGPSGAPTFICQVAEEQHPSLMTAPLYMLGQRVWLSMWKLVESQKLAPCFVVPFPFFIYCHQKSKQNTQSKGS